MASISTGEPAQLSLESFHRFAEFITRELGIKMPEQKIPMLQGRLARRLRALELSTLDEYQAYLFDAVDGGKELAEFIDVVTTNKTDFLREPKHFDYLTATALPELDPGPGQRWDCQVWCAGCSTGEEAYTLAMALDSFASQRSNFAFSVFASDISTRVLRTARTAVYDENRIEPLPLEWRKKHLLRSRDESRAIVRVAPTLRQRVQFARLNFMDTDYRIKPVFDVVFFRNVMIYFDRPTQEAVVRRLCDQLRPGGYIFIGHSETLMGLALPVRMVASAVYRKTR